MPRPYHSIAIPPAPEHDEGVGIGRAQRLVQRGRAAIMAGEADMPDFFQRQFEGCRLL
jgi:hypothetical protein